MVTKIKQIFKQAVLRFWSLRVPLIVVCILLAALRCTAQYQDSSRVASAQMTLNYSEASQGLNPNRTRFTTTDLTSDEVLQSTLYNAGLEGQMTVEQLRKAITVEPTDVTNVSSSENYITTSCSISLQLEEPCQHLTAATLLRIFCGSYKDYFMEHYGENQSVFSCTMPDYFDTEPYLRLKSLTLRADQLDRYLTARVSENKSYQDATTGNTFLSLSKQIQNVINYEIPRIQAYILRGGLSADVSSLTAMLQYKLQIEQLDYQEHQNGAGHHGQRRRRCPGGGDLPSGCDHHHPVCGAANADHERPGGSDHGERHAAGTGNHHGSDPAGTAGDGCLLYHL